MNWKLIGQLSLFGLAMAVGTVFFIPSNVEFVCWIVIFLICAYLIGVRLREGHFLHGLLLGIANSVWVTAAHVLFFAQYLERHAAEAAMMDTMPMPMAVHPRVVMAVTGPVVGVVSGLVIGLLALVAGRLFAARRREPTLS